MNILLLNAGSSSLKASLINSTDGSVIARATADWAGAETHYRYVGSDGTEHADDAARAGHASAVERVIFDMMHVEPVVLRDHSALAAVGHRVVHGGQFTSAVKITSAVRSRISALADLAPLHNPPSLQTLAAAEKALPNVTHVAVFDTAFHATLAPEAYTYAVPERWTREWGIRRFGFHGLSHAYCSRRAAEMLEQPVENLRLVICHLGHGCSASAVRGGRCVDTTMGFTPLEGLMMATRSGSIDPAILLYIQQNRGLTAAQVETSLNHESGLLGVSGISGDMRQVLAGANDGDKRARLALDMYTHRVRQAIGALSVTLGGIDALVFTAGVGENASEIRESVCTGLECLGLELNTRRNVACIPDMDVTRPGSRGRILVIATREDVTMLHEVIEVLTEKKGNDTRP
jgi:acetate kinase